MKYSMRFLYKNIDKPPYKYELLEDKVIHLDKRYLNFKGRDFILRGRKLTLLKGYKWNGSDVVIDIKACMLPSAVHDALCVVANQIYKDSGDAKRWYRIRKKADRQYYVDLMRMGMPYLRALVRYQGLKLYSKKKYLLYR